MKEDKDYIKMEHDIIKCLDRHKYTSAEAYMVLDVVKFVYMARAFTVYKEK